MAKTGTGPNAKFDGDGYAVIAYLEAAPRELVLLQAVGVTGAKAVDGKPETVSGTHTTPSRNRWQSAPIAAKRLKKKIHKRGEDNSFESVRARCDRSPAAVGSLKGRADTG